MRLSNNKPLPAVRAAMDTIANDDFLTAEMNAAIRWQSDSDTMGIATAFALMFGALWRTCGIGNEKIGLLCLCAIPLLAGCWIVFGFKAKSARKKVLEKAAKKLQN